MKSFKINWQHNYKGDISNHVTIKSFKSEQDLSAVEAAEKYAESLSCGDYSVSEIKDNK